MLHVAWALLCNFQASYLQYLICSHWLYKTFVHETCFVKTPRSSREPLTCGRLLHITLLRQYLALDLRGRDEAASDVREALRLEMLGVSKTLAAAR